MGNGTFFSRAGAAKAAAIRNMRSFESVPVTDFKEAMWTFEERDECPALDYGLLFAKGKDWISHVEVSLKRKPILVVTVTKAELATFDIPAAFSIEPVTPSLWDTDAEHEKFAEKARREAAMSRSSSAPASGAPRAPRAPPTPRVGGAPSRKSIVRDLMLRDNGVTLGELAATFEGSSKAALTALVSDVKRMGYTVQTTKSVKDDDTRYKTNPL